MKNIKSQDIFINLLILNLTMI